MRVDRPAGEWEARCGAGHGGWQGAGPRHCGGGLGRRETDEAAAGAGRLRGVQADRGGAVGRGRPGPLPAEAAPSIVAARLRADMRGHSDRGLRRPAAGSQGGQPRAAQKARPEAHSDAALAGHRTWLGRTVLDVHAERCCRARGCCARVAGRAALRERDAHAHGCRHLRAGGWAGEEAAGRRAGVGTSARGDGRGSARERGPGGCAQRRRASPGGALVRRARVRAGHLGQVAGDRGGGENPHASSN